MCLMRMEISGLGNVNQYVALDVIGAGAGEAKRQINIVLYSSHRFDVVRSVIFSLSTRLALVLCIFITVI